MATAAELRSQRDTARAAHKKTSVAERRELTDQIEALMKRVRRYERENGLEADLPVDEQPAELRALTEQVEALRAQRAPRLRPVGFGKLQAGIRKADQAEAAARTAVEVDALADELGGKSLHDHSITDAALEQVHHTLAAEFASMSRRLAAVAAERSRRAKEAAARKWTAEMTKEEKEDLLRLLQEEPEQDDLAP